MPADPPRDTSPTTGAGQVAAPPGGLALATAKRAAERLLWTRVALQRRLRRARPEAPVSTPVTGVLQNRAEWERSVEEARRLRLPLHRDRPKNWDALGAVRAVVTLADDGSRTARVVDAGSARYSSVLPWLRLYGFGAEPGSLVGTNLEFGDPVTRDGVEFRFGDVTATDFPDGGLDAITCMSVIEHGVPVESFLSESARVLRPGGVLVVSTDFDHDPPDTTGIRAYGAPVRIFGPADIAALVDHAASVGLDLVGDLGTMSHPDRPVHWRRTGLDYTFVLLTFRRRAAA